MDINSKSFQTQTKNSSDNDASVKQPVGQLTRGFLKFLSGRNGVVSLRDKKTLCLFMVIGILFLGGFLRFYQLDRESLWYDEAKSVSLAKECNFRTIWNEDDATKPLFYLLILRPWIKIFGVTEYSVRFPAVILGVLSIFLIYKVGSLFFNRKTGLIAGLLLAVSPLSIYYSRQADYSSAKIPMALLAMFLFFKNIRNQNNFFLLTIINIALIYTHPFCFLLVVVENIIVALFYKNDWGYLRRWLQSQLFVFLACVLWLIIFYRVDTLANATDWVAIPTGETILRTVEALSHGVYRFALGGSGYTVYDEYLVMPRVLFVMYIFFFLYGCVSLKKTSGHVRQNLVIVLTWLFVPVVILFIFSKLFFPVYADRYVMFCLPAYYLFLAYTLSMIPRKVVSGSIVAVIAALHFFPLRILYAPDSTNMDNIYSWREIGKKVRNSIMPGGIIVLSPLRQIVPFWYYYKPEERTNKQIDIMGSEKNEQSGNVYRDNDHLLIGAALGEGEEFIKKNSKIFKSADTIWFIVSPGWAGQKAVGQYLINYFYRNYVLIEMTKYPYHGVEVYCFGKKTSL